MKWEKLKNCLAIDSWGKELVIRLVSSWLISAVFLTIGVEDFLNLDFCNQVSLVPLFAYCIGAFVVFTVVRLLVPKITDSDLLLVVVMLFAVRALRTSNDVYFLLGVSFFVSMIYIYCYADSNHCFKEMRISDCQMWFIIGGVAVIVTAFVGKIIIARHLAYCSSNYDLGIFVQTFYNLKEHFTLNNTCERNYPISHLQVHTSLFYYVLAPIYWLVPKAQTLLVVQIIAVATGVVPFALLAKLKGMSNQMIVGSSVVYLLSLGSWGGCFYDFHENVFLLPLLLWCFYCYEAKKTKLLFIAALAVCTIKEDASFYILVFAFYILFSQGKKELKKGIGLTVLAGTYMVCVFAYLSEYGLGLMSNRFSNLMTDESLLSMFKVLLMNPAYFFTQIFNIDKIPFMIVLFLPMIGVLTSTKQYHRFILLIPVLLINLLPEYVYMHAIFFHYVFGSGAFLMYLFTLNIADMEKDKGRKMIGLAACLMLLTFVSQVQPKREYIERYENDVTDMRETIEEAFELIPDDASVLADTFFVPHLANREVIYMLEKSEVEQKTIYNVDYVIFDIREGYTMQNYEDAIYLYMSNGYEEIYRADGNVLLLKNADRVE